MTRVARHPLARQPKAQRTPWPRSGTNAWRRCRRRFETLEARRQSSTWTNQLFATQAFHDLTAQGIPPALLSDWTRSLDHDAPRDRIALGIERTRAYRNHLVQDWFDTNLGQPASRSQYQRALSVLIQGRSWTGVEASSGVQSSVNVEESDPVATGIDIYNAASKRMLTVSDRVFSNNTRYRVDPLEDPRTNRRGNTFN